MNLAIALTKAVERDLEIGDTRTAVLNLQRGIRAQFEGLDYKEIDSETEKTVFELGSHSTWGNLGHIVIPLQNTGNSPYVYKLEFYFDPFEGWALLAASLIPAFALFCLLILRRSEKNLSRLFITEVALKEAEMRSNVARQVAHDIRSPLASLEVAQGELEALPEDVKALIQSAVCRIKDIANDLLEPNQGESNFSMDAADEGFRSSEILVSELIEQIIAEKRMQFRGFGSLDLQATIDFDSYLLFSKVNRIDFQRVLSNLVNNSVEALINGGKVQIDVTNSGPFVQIRIKDSGKGIAEEVLNKLLRAPASFDKPGGNGLGLSHATDRVASWGGTFAIASKLGSGTEVSFTVPTSSAPDWFCSKIPISRRSNIVVIDDDQTIHELWKKRFRECAPELNIICFVSASSFNDWYRNLNETVKSEMVILVDYEFTGLQIKGTDILKGIPKYKDAILVTSYYKVREIQTFCKENSVKVLPKMCSGFVPILADI